MRALGLAALFVIASQSTACGMLRGADRRTQGSFTAYATQPIPEVTQPIARTMSIDVISVNSASEVKFYGHSTGGVTVTFAGDVLTRIGGVMTLNLPLKDDNVLETLEIVLREWFEGQGRAGVRHTRAKDAKGLSSVDQGLVEQQEQRAAQARASGDYASAQLHTNAALGHLETAHALDRQASAAKVAVAVMNMNSALVDVGNKMRRESLTAMSAWMEGPSGAVGPAGPEGTHLSVYLVHYVAATAFKLDTRSRYFVYLALSRPEQAPIQVVEGSDLFVCFDECEGFTPPPEAVPFARETSSADVAAIYFEQEGMKATIQDNGFGVSGGPYHYLLLKHGLAHLSARATEAAATPSYDVSPPSSHP